MTYNETHDTAAKMAAAGAPVAPAQPTAKNVARKKVAPQHPAAGGKNRASSKKKSKAKAKAKAGRAKSAAAPRAESKSAQILALIGRSKGATLAEIRKTTGWQAHSVRGYLSNAAKKHNLQIESTKVEGGDRVYRIKK